ncbi:hypothetical protein [Kocuria palustris]|uniref:hypothetical protein n=1 Tax=Kocuria palustris TaxID=71999 RepID=UPI000738DEE9|nr:hypothetical protein [Kocuria palustris]KUG56102.1 hypothetical protein AVL60_04500 [Kocuria palustris]
MTASTEPGAIQSEAKFIQGLLYGWSDWGDTTARTDIPTALQMADLPLAVRGMLLVASDGFLDQVEDQAHGLGHGVGIVREFLMHEHERQRRSRAHARLRDTFGLPLDDGGSRERSRIEELAGRDLGALRERDIPDLQRVWIIENLCRAELDGARLERVGPPAHCVSGRSPESDLLAHSLGLPEVDAVVMRVGAASCAFGACKVSDTRKLAEPLRRGASCEREECE